MKLSEDSSSCVVEETDCSDDEINGEEVVGVVLVVGNLSFVPVGLVLIVISKVVDSKVGECMLVDVGVKDELVVSFWYVLVPEGWGEFV